MQESFLLGDQWVTVQVQPEYDGKWFVRFANGRIKEASTLAELALKLGPGYQLIGYYPNGYHERPKWPDPVKIEKEPKRIMEPREKKKRETYDHEAILNLWVQGFTAPEIAKKLGIEYWPRVGEIVCSARQKGDPRAVARGPGNR